MKGPGLRNDLEIRRTWKCPLCGRTVKYLGNVVAAICDCTDATIQMQLQPDIKKAPPQFEKVVIPLTEEDLIVRERPRRVPEPSENPAENDRRPMRPKRPKPERQSFESFQEQLGTAEPSASLDTSNPETASNIEPPPEPPKIQREVPSQQDPTEDTFGEGLS